MAQSYPILQNKHLLLAAIARSWRVKDCCRVMLWSCGHRLIHWRLNWKKPRNILLNGQTIEIMCRPSNLCIHLYLSQFQHEVTECASGQLTSPRNFDFHVIPPGLLPLPWLFLSATCSGRFQDQIVQSPWGWRAACSKWVKLLSRVLDYWARLQGRMATKNHYCRLLVSMKESRRCSQKQRLKAWT